MPSMIGFEDIILWKMMGDFIGILLWIKWDFDECDYFIDFEEDDFKLQAYGIMFICDVVVVARVYFISCSLFGLSLPAMPFMAS